MDLSVALKGLLQTLFLPPGGPLLLIIAGLLIMRRAKHIATFFVVTGVTSLYVLSMPFTALLLRDVVEVHPPLGKAELLYGGAEAIVILGGGRYIGAREYDDQDVVNLTTLARLRYGAYLQRKSHLPILVTGGSPRDEGISEAALMDKSLREDFGLSARWLEERSDNTFENARFSAKILQRNHIKKVILVTHANHMARSVEAFERAGVTVLPAPTQMLSRGGGDPELWDFLPNLAALYNSQTVIHELLGQIWYKHVHYDQEGMSRIPK